MTHNQHSQNTSNFYNASYKNLGFNAQRKYPNEELCRFMGRNFFSISPDERSNIKILETGCGSGANLWMIAREGFSAYGIDISQEGLSLCHSMLDSYGVSGDLSLQDMSQLSFSDNFFDAVIDVFSSNCLTKAQHTNYLERVSEILKPGGLFFSYFPSKNSDSYQFPGESDFIDSDTLSAVLRKDSPFYGQHYPFRFIHPREYEDVLKEHGFYLQYSETVSRTYRTRQEKFEFVVIEAKKL